VSDCLVETGAKVTKPDLKLNLLGYDIIWYYEDTEFEWEFLGYSVSEDFTLTAELKVKKEMENFVFTSTADTCVITGAKMRYLPNLYIPGYVTEIASSAFEYCNFEEIIISEGVTKIGTRAFNGNDDLNTLTFPSSITYLGKRIFGSCSASTITINYNGTTQEWKAIETPSDISWSDYSDSTFKVVCTNGTLTYN